MTEQLEPAPAHLELQLGLVGQQLVLDDVSGELAVHGDDLVAGLEAGPGGGRPGGHRHHSGQGHDPPRIGGATAGRGAWGWPCHGRGTPGPGSLGRVDVERVLLASPRGFCAGVEMAIKALAWMTRVFEPPVYCYHEIVHNQVVVERFRQLGVVFVDDVSEVPGGRAAHAVRPRLAARGGRGGPGPRRGGRQRRLPAREEGPPRGQGAGRQGLHASSTSATRATRRRSARWPWRPTPCTGSST